MKLKLSNRMVVVSTKKIRTIADYEVGQEVRITDKEGIYYGNVTEITGDSILVKCSFTPDPIEFFQHEFSSITPR